VQIKDPIAHEGIFVIVSARDDRPLKPAVVCESEESAESCRHPQITETVFEQIMKVFVRQAILSACIAPVVPSGQRRSRPVAAPTTQRAVLTVFHNRIDGDPTMG